MVEGAFRAAAAAISVLLLSVAAYTQETSTPSTTRQDRIDAARKAHTERALALLKRCSDYLAGQDAFQFVIEEGFDVLQASGQMLEFGARRVVTVRRPDRLRVEERQRDSHDSVLYYDGSRLSVFFPKEMAYASIEKSGTIEQLIDYVTAELGATAPLRDLLRRDSYGFIEDRIESGLVVGKSRLAGRRCDHLAFRSDTTDAQIWIESGERPLPRRIIFTYKTSPGNPQFRAQFISWDLDPDAGDSEFVFSPPVGAERLPVEAVVSRKEEK